MKNFQKSMFPRWALAAAVLAGLTACASSEVDPIDNMASARTAISQAESVGAAQNAPVEFLAARDAMAKAEAAQRAEDFATAKMQAQQAEVSAQLANRKSRTAKAQKAADEFTKSNEMLRNELQRKTAP